MGRRALLETATKLLVCFIENRSWEQAALARRVGVTTRTLRGHLLTLGGEGGIPLHRDEENRSCVYWSVPKGWLPGAAALPPEEVAHCCRLLARLPRTEARDRLLSHLLRGSTSKPVPNDIDGNPGDAVLSALEDGLRARTPVSVMYRSTTRAQPAVRTLSVQRIVYGARLRVVAHCHRTRALRWFRVDRVEHASPDDLARFAVVEPGEVDAFLGASVDGYRGAGALEEIAFWVRDPEARWAISNLPPMSAIIAEESGGVAVRCRTAALDVLARWLVGLGAAVTIDTPGLRERVVGIAEESLARHGTKRPLAKAHDREHEHRLELVADRGPRGRRSRKGWTK